jgi:hypothetical protein
VLLSGAGDNLCDALPALMCFIDDSHSDWGGIELNVVVICISLFVKDVEHFFMHFTGHFSSSFGKCLSSSIAPVLIR